MFFDLMWKNNFNAGKWGGGGRGLANLIQNLRETG